MGLLQDKASAKYRTCTAVKVGRAGWSGSSTAGSAISEIVRMDKNKFSKVETIQEIKKRININFTNFINNLIQSLVTTLIKEACDMLPS